MIHLLSKLLKALTADDTIDGNAGTDIIYLDNDDDAKTVGDATTAAFGANVFLTLKRLLLLTLAVNDGGTAGDVTTVTINAGLLRTALTIDGSALDAHPIDLTSGERLSVTSNRR